MAIQRYVAERVGMAPGSLTVFSHSLGINPAATEYERARTLADQWVNDNDYDEARRAYSLRRDPNGAFVVYADIEKAEIVAEHWSGGVMIKRYHHRRAESLARAISADMAVTLLSHALWLGRELASTEWSLRSGTARGKTGPSAAES